MPVADEKTVLEGTGKCWTGLCILGLTLDELADVARHRGGREDRDLVLVLDVNRDFRPWLVERERLYRALDTVDRASGKKRGLLLVR